ncbi:MAG: hypothetical protein WBC67_06590 [Candidatus Acidiferrales bacterium]
MALISVLIVGPVGRLPLLFVFLLVSFLLVLGLFLLGLLFVLLRFLSVLLRLFVGAWLLLRFLIVLMARLGFRFHGSGVRSFGGIAGWSFRRFTGGLPRSIIRRLRGGFFVFVVGLLLGVNRCCCEHAQDCRSYE